MNFRTVYTWDNGHLGVENLDGRYSVDFRSNNQNFPNFFYGSEGFNFSSHKSKNLDELGKFFACVALAYASKDWTKVVRFVAGDNYEVFHKEYED